MKKIKRISNETEIPKASEESLRRMLLTPDGRGAKLKEKCLEELLDRVLEPYLAER